MVPLEIWVRKAVDDVFFGVPASLEPRGGGIKGGNDISVLLWGAHLAAPGGNAAG